MYLPLVKFWGGAGMTSKRRRRDLVDDIMEREQSVEVQSSRRPSDGKSLVGLPEIRSRRSIITPDRYGEMLDLNRALDQHLRADSELDRMLNAKVQSSVIDSDTGRYVEMDAPVDMGRVALVKTMLASAQYKIDKFMANPRPVEIVSPAGRGEVEREINPLELATKLAFAYRKAKLQKIEIPDEEEETPEWLT